MPLQHRVPAWIVQLRALRTSGFHCGLLSAGDHARRISEANLPEPYTRWLADHGRGLAPPRIGGAMQVIAASGAVVTDEQCPGHPLRGPARADDRRDSDTRPATLCAWRPSGAGLRAAPDLFAGTLDTISAILREYKCPEDTAGQAFKSTEYGSGEVSQGVPEQHYATTHISW